MWKTINEAYQWIVSVDPSTSIKKYTLRSIVAQGYVATLKLGVKVLLNMRQMKQFLDMEDID